MFKAKLNRLCFMSSLATAALASDNLVLDSRDIPIAPTSLSLQASAQALRWALTGIGPQKDTLEYYLQHIQEIEWLCAGISESDYKELDNEITTHAIRKIASPLEFFMEITQTPYQAPYGSILYSTRMHFLTPLGGLPIIAGTTPYSLSNLGRRLGPNLKEGIRTHFYNFDVRYFPSMMRPIESHLFIYNKDQQTLRSCHHRLPQKKLQIKHPQMLWQMIKQHHLKQENHKIEKSLQKARRYILTRS